VRLRILWALLQGERSVGQLAELVGAQVLSVSQHLAKLRLARLVEFRRGRSTYYRATNVHVHRMALHHADHVVQGLPDHGSAP